MKALTLVVALLAMPAHAGDRDHFNAREAVQRAQVGTHSPRLAPPVRVESARFRANGHRNPSNQQDFDRMQCRRQESTDSIVCVAKRAEKVNRPKK